MKYGYFDDNAREYVINTPATPLPWINYLGTNGFFSLISNTTGGYSFYQDAKLRRITRYRYNNIPEDMGSRFYYIKDANTTWSPGYLPSKTTLDDYRCRHGLGYTVLESSKNSLSSKLTCFVPLNVNCEINQLTLKNDSSLTKSIQLYGAVEWCFWNAVDDAQNFQRNLNLGEVEIDGSTLYHSTEYRERRNHYAFYSVNAPTAGFDTDRDSFIGQFGTWEAPTVVQEGKSHNSIASGWRPIACNRLDVDLKPGEEKTFIFMLGYVENSQEQKWESTGAINKKLAKQMISRFYDTDATAAALSELAAYWDGYLKRFHIKSNDKKLDRMINIWNQYQCMVTFSMSRSASYFESGISRGIGLRDTCQDILGFVHLIPDRVRERILNLAAIQLEDGSTYHQYQPLTKRGNKEIGSGFSDDPLWLIACTAAYIRETGDNSILDEPVPFDNVQNSARPLFEHLRRSISYIVSHRGPHDLPLIGRADWNDCLNLNCFSEYPDKSFQTCDTVEGTNAESVLIAAMFIKYGEEYAELCRRFGSPEEADEVLRQVADMKKAVLSHGWDGDWFLRAYDAFGNKVGSHTCKEGQIFIEPQGFCAMAGVGIKEGYAKQALLSVKNRLTTKFGIELLSPCYTKYYKELGEITSYPPGYKENGSIFCHVNPWISIAETKIGNPESAFDIYQLTCPAYAEEFSDTHRTEPYVYSQTIAGRSASHFGEAKNSWLTGTAAWSFVNISQAILGIQPHYDGLIIDPCVPAALNSYTVRRWYRGAEYLITVANTNAKARVMKVDGKVVDGKTVLFVEGKTRYNVEVTI